MSGKIIKSEFEAAKGLKNPHWQTMYQALFRKVPKLTPRRERLELPNEDFVDLDWVGEGDGPIVVILHGMAGSLDSYYATGIMQQIEQRGWRGVIMYYRGMSGGPNRLMTHTHLGETESVDFLIKTLVEREPDTPLAAVGYSMGGNMLLKWQGKAENHNPLKCAIAVSVPFDLRQASNYMRHGPSSFYQWMLMKDLRRYTEDKYCFRNQPEDLQAQIDELQNIRSFWQFDESITAPLHGYKDAAEYYYHSSCINYLSGIMAPTLILQAQDDPFMPETVLPIEAQLADNTVLELSAHGGHVGFVSGTVRKPIYWLDHRVPEFLEQYLPV